VTSNHHAQQEGRSSQADEERADSAVAAAGSGRRIAPKKIGPGVSAAELVDAAFLAYNGARLREACRLFVDRMLQPEVTVGVSLTGALTPAGLGMSCLVPLIEQGMVDWMVSTGANLYHDAHFGLGMALHRGGPFMDDVRLRKDGVVRIYDILFDYRVLLDTDAFFREIIRSDAFQQDMGSAEFHALTGKYLQERSDALGLEGQSLLTAACRAGVPVYTSSPGDSSIGMNVAAEALKGNRLRLDPSVDVNETAGIVYHAKKSGGKSAVLILGGGSPKNFLLQTEPQIQEVLGLDERGHDYFIQITDARPDTGGLSGATPSEAVSWGKVDPSRLPDAVVCYCDITVALPLLTAYAMDRHQGRPLRRLYDRREAMLANLRQDFLESV